MTVFIYLFIYFRTRKQNEHVLWEYWPEKARKNAMKDKVEEGKM